MKIPQIFTLTPLISRKYSDKQKKRDCNAISLVFWVKKGARTLDPRNHNPML